MYKEKTYQKPWEVDVLCDFNKLNGAFPLWACLFLPIFAPVAYLIIYYLHRKELKR